MNPGIASGGGASPYVPTETQPKVEPGKSSVTTGIQNISLEHKVSVQNTPVSHRAVSATGASAVQRLEPPKDIVSAESPEKALEKLTEFTPTGRDLGVGGRGVVSVWRDASGTELAIKIIKTSSKGDNAPSDRSYHGMEAGEINSLRIPDHPNIVKCHGLLLQKKRTDRYCIARTERDIPEAIKPFYVRAVLMDKVQGAYSGQLEHSFRFI